MPRGEQPESVTTEIPARLRIAGNVVRAVFIAILLVLTARVSVPQNERIWSAYETPGDLVRIALGFGACMWIIFHIFTPPKDSIGYRTWLYLGLAAIPFGLICLFAVW
jgi:hypothetical protein